MEEISGREQIAEFCIIEIDDIQVSVQYANQSWIISAKITKKATTFTVIAFLNIIPTIIRFSC
jgi:hypothetical protein